ncbi:hypothetical protein AB0H12_19980 [Actinosynnema sp. NPDC023794]
MKVVHELGHQLGLNHYNSEYHGEHAPMGQRTVDLVSSWNDVLWRGDKAGLPAMAGWRDRAKACAQRAECTPIWYKDGDVAWPPRTAGPTARRDEERRSAPAGTGVGRFRRNEPS